MNVCPRGRYYDQVYVVSAILILSHRGQQSLPSLKMASSVKNKTHFIKKKNDVF